MTELIEGLTPHAGWIAPGGEFHKLGGDEKYWHLHWIRDNQHKIPQQFHARLPVRNGYEFDTNGTMLNMMAGGWIRKSDKDGYETTASHEHKAEGAIKAHIRQHHPDVTEFMLDVNHPHGGFSHSKVLRVDRPSGRIVTDIARARAFAYGGESFADTLIKVTLAESYVEKYGFVLANGDTEMRERKPEQDVVGGQHVHTKIAQDLGYHDSTDAVFGNGGHAAVTVTPSDIHVHLDKAASQVHQHVGKFLKKHWAGHRIVLDTYNDDVDFGDDNRDDIGYGQGDAPTVHHNPDSAIATMRSWKR